MNGTPWDDEDPIRASTEDSAVTSGIDHGIGAGELISIDLMDFDDDGPVSAADALVLDPVDIAWRDHVFILDDDPDLEEWPDDVSPMPDSGLSTRERALQLAAAICADLMVDDETQTVVENIFTLSPHWKTREAVQRMLLSGIGPETLAACFRLRIWWSHSSFQNPIDGDQSWFGCVPWETARVIIESFGTVPDDEELEDFLWTAFIAYRDSPVEREVSTFPGYLHERLSGVPALSAISPHIHIGDLSRYGEPLFDPVDIWEARIPARATLDTLGVPVPRYRR